MGSGASTASAPPESLKVTSKERSRLRKQAHSVGMSKESLRFLFNGFGQLPSFHNGSAVAHEITLLPQFAGVPLLGKIAPLYGSPDGRIQLQDLLNLVTEWSDLPPGNAGAVAAVAAAAADGPADTPAPLAADVRMKKVFQAPDSDDDGLISVDDIVSLLESLSNGSVDGDVVRQVLAERAHGTVSGEGNRGFNFDKFRSLIGTEDLLLKTTVRI